MSLATNKHGGHRWRCVRNSDRRVVGHIGFSRVRCVKCQTLGWRKGRRVVTRPEDSGTCRANVMSRALR
jgi:hypothetical protein